MKTSLASAFAHSAQLHSSKTAVFWGDDIFTFGELYEQSRAVAAVLRTTLGVKPGDRVAIWLRNCPQFISALFGIFQSGGAAVPINNFLKPDEVSFILGDAGADVLISDGAANEALERLVTMRPGLKVLRVEQLPTSAPAGFSPAEVSASDLAVLIYTSGTTGHPKGAMLTHANLLHNVASCKKVLEAVDVDRFALMLPMFHSFMITVCVLLPLLVGSSVVLIKSLHPPKAIFEEIIRHQATVLPAIPQLFRALAHATAVPPDLCLRLCISGAAPLPVEVLKEFSARFPFPLIEGYGLSEASPVVSLNPIHGVQKPGSIGLPIADVEVSIRGEDGQEVPLGQTGEVCVRGGNVMAGYWNKPEETARAIREGWLYTGDIGRKDEEGYFYITDRKKDMLLVNGINVYPREVEEVIYRYPGIREAAVIGRPDPRKGEQPVAFVAVNEGAHVDGAALQRFLKEHLADYKVPRHIVQLTALPRNATGKVLKTTLRTLPVDG